MDYRHFILDYLLTKYENSAHYYGTAKIKRRLFFNFNKKTIPAYLAGENPQIKEAVHQTVKELEQQGILAIEWVAGEKDNLLKRVSLNLEKAEAAYELIGRIPKRAELAALNSSIQAVRAGFKTSWIKDFLTDCQL